MDAAALARHPWPETVGHAIHQWSARTCGVWRAVYISSAQELGGAHQPFGQMSTGKMERVHDGTDQFAIADKFKKVARYVNLRGWMGEKKYRNREIER